LPAPSRRSRWFSRGGADRAAAVAQDTVTAVARADSIAQARESGTAAIVAPMAIVDTARVNARLALKHQRDSLARIANVANHDTAAVRAPLIRYKQAIESGNVATIKNAYPAMSSGQQGQWERNAAGADKISVSIRYGPSTMQGDIAEATFNLSVTIVYKDSKPPIFYSYKQRAKLARQGGRWQIVSLGA
jgi:hypothetical protein